MNTVEIRKMKVLFSKAGGTASANSYTTKISLPKSWINEMGITKEDREVKMSFIDGKIIIERT